MCVYTGEKKYVKQMTTPAPTLKHQVHYHLHFLPYTYFPDLYSMPLRCAPFLEFQKFHQFILRIKTIEFPHNEVHVQSGPAIVCYQKFYFLQEVKKPKKKKIKRKVLFANIHAIQGGKSITRKLKHKKRYRIIPLALEHTT